MKKNGEAYGDFDGRMYPFSSCSLMNSHSESSSPLAMGYILQSNDLGASGSNSIAWSHVLAGGNLCDSFSLNVRACWRYSSGTICSKVFFVGSMAFCANSDAVVVLHSEAYGSSCCSTISSHSSLVVSAAACTSSGLLLDMTTG